MSNLKCENCDNDHNGDFGSGRFCCIKCSRSFSTKAKRSLINEKVSKKLKGKIRGKVPKHDNAIKQCPGCKREYNVPWKKRDQIYCSQQCQWEYGNRRPEVRQKLSVAAKKRVENGTHNGWPKRRKNEPASYAEKFFMTVLDNNNLTYEFDYKVNRYWIDFAFFDKKIGLEIDGKQHEYEDRKKSDEVKDKILTDLGWKMFRIKWKNPVSKVNKNYIKNKIQDFLEFYKDSEKCC